MKKIKNLFLLALLLPNLTEANAQTIGASAFEGCTSLDSINLYNCTVGTTAFKNSSVKTVNIDGDASISSGAFSSCASLRDIDVKNLTSWGDTVLIDCKSLSHIGLNETYKKDSLNCYVKNNKLIAACKNTVIPETVTEIGGYAYAGQTGVANVVIPESVKKIDDYAFLNCTGLRGVQVAWEMPLSINAAVFDVVNLENATLYVPEDTEDYYSVAKVWRDFGNVKVGNITTINADVNGDGTVDISDVNNVISVICGGSSTPGADVNGDGTVDTSDVNAIIGKICGQ